MATTDEAASAARTASETSPLLAQDAGDAGAVESNEAQNGTVEGSGSSPDEAPPVNSEMKQKMHLLLPALGIGLFLVAIDQLLAVAMYAKIGSELKALNNTSWIATSYLFTLTCFQPLCGKLSDIFGRKPLLLFCYTVFAIGSLGCGLAQDLPQLCVARAISGIGGAGMTTLVSILMSDIVTLRERGVYQGYINILYTTGTATGGPLGGFLADSVGWRWSFLAQVPLCAIAVIAVYVILQLPPKDNGNLLAKLKRIDFAGAITLITGVVALSLGLDSGSNVGWSNLKTIIPLALTPLFFGIFLIIEMKFARNPFAPGHIIFDRSLFACYATNFLCSAGSIGVIFFLPLFYQAVSGLNATAAGALLVPGMLASVSASVGSGWLIKKTGKFYKMAIASFALQLVSILPLVLSLWKQSILGAEIGLVLTTFGSAVCITATLIAMLANSEPEDAAVVISCSYLFRSLGSTTGISVVSAVMQQTLRTQLAERLPNEDDAREVEEKVRQSLDFIKQLPPVLAEKVRTSYQMAIVGSYIPIVAFFAVAFLLAFAVREKALKR